MSSRREFLAGLFAQLDARGLAFCVLRNFDRVFDADGSDVDLLARPLDASSLLAACDEAATVAGFSLVQATRFVNHSRCYWRAEAGFVRIDVDTEIRWRWLHALSAGEVLAARLRRGEFWIPSEHHEAEILRAQLAWVDRESYKQRLAELGEPGTNSAAMRRALVLRTACDPRRWLLAARYFARDAGRWIERWRRPPGASVEVFAAGKFDAGTLREKLAGLFPMMKNVADGGRIDRRALFRGGLAICEHRVSADAALPARSGPAPGPSHFICLVETSGAIHAAHAGSGAVASCRDAEELARFIAGSLALENAAPVRCRGAAIVLAGLDGAGKTTFARELTKQAVQAGFAGVRYFHWIPRRCELEFPWPAFVETTRKPPASRSMAGRAFSLVRLARSVVLAHIAFALRVKPLIRDGWLVILDRYVTNYWLDPDSVRFGAAARWLALARPLFPQADTLIALQADTATLQSRKGELAADEIERQRTRLKSLPPLAATRLDLDARQSPEALARQALAHLAKLNA